MAFHTDSVEFDYSDYRDKGMADIQFAIYAAKNSIKLTSLKHAKNWIKHTDKIDLSDTIYSKNKNDDGFYTNAINEVEWSELCVTQ